MAITLFEYQVLYLLLHFLKFLLDLLRQVPCVVFLILHQPVILPQRLQNLNMISLHVYHTNHLRYFTSTHIHLQCSFFYFVTILFIPFFLLLLLVSFAYTIFFLGGAGGLTCHYYLFHNMFGVFVYQYCVIRVLLCLITSTFVLYKKKKHFCWLSLCSNYFFVKVAPN